MKLPTKEKEIVLLLFKDFATWYNARTISSVVGMSHRGALKALKMLEQKNILLSRPFGKAILYTPNFKNPIAKKTIELYLLEEAELEYKRWVEEFKGFTEAEILVFFGSAAEKHKKYNDIDLLIVLKKEAYKSIMKKIEEKNIILPKPVHPVFQTEDDFKRNILARDPVVLGAIKKGIILKGQLQLVGVVSDVSGFRAP